MITAKEMLDVMREVESEKEKECIYDAFHLMEDVGLVDRDEWDTFRVCIIARSFKKQMI